MLEMAEETIWDSRTVLRLANCVYLCSVHKAEEGQYSMERYSHRSAYLGQGTRRRQFYKDNRRRQFYKGSSRAFTRKLTRTSIEVLAINADERGLANARRTFSSLTAVYPETRRTERAGLRVRTKFLERELYFC